MSITLEFDDPTIFAICSGKCCQHRPGAKVGNYFGKAGYAPFHDLDSEVPAEVKTKMEEINTALVGGSLQTGVPPVKP